MAIASSYGASLGERRGRFFGSLFLSIPIVNHVIFLGCIAIAALSAAEGAVVVSGLSASSLGIQQDSVLKYEAAIDADGFLVMVHGMATEMAVPRAYLVRAIHQASKIILRRTSTPRINARRLRRPEASAVPGTPRSGRS